MERNLTKNLLSTLTSKVAVMAFSASMLLTSCVVYTGGYSETDGVYYDPNTDTLPTGYGVTQSGNEVGEYYDYQDTSIIQNNNQVQAEKNKRLRASNNSESDWGNLTGNEINYTDWGFNNYWGYGGMYSPWYGGGFYSPWNNYWGYGMGYYGSMWNWGSSWSIGWGRPWGWNMGMNWGWGSPWYGGYYSPWNWGYGMGYYGYYRPHHYYNTYPSRPSGHNNGMINNSNVNGRYGNTNRVPGMSSTNGSRNPGVQSGNRMNENGVNRNRQQQVRPNGNMNQRVPDNYNNRTNTNDNFRNNGGFRDSGSFRSSGGFNNGGGGFGGGNSRSGGGMSGGGGMRSGGGR